MKTCDEEKPFFVEKTFPQNCKAFSWLVSTKASKVVVLKFHQNCSKFKACKKLSTDNSLKSSSKSFFISNSPKMNFPKAQFLSSKTNIIHILLYSFQIKTMFRLILVQFDKKKYWFGFHCVSKTKLHLSLNGVIFPKLHVREAKTKNKKKKLWSRAQSSPNQNLFISASLNKV